MGISAYREYYIACPTEDAIVAPIGVQEYSVTIKLQVVTKEDRRHIAEMALAVIKDAVRSYGPDIRSGELVEIQLEEKPTEKKYD